MGLASINYYYIITFTNFLYRYGADGIERRKVLKNAFKVIYDNIIPDTHKPFIFHIKHRKTVSKEELSAKMKKLKATKKAASELNEKDRLFYTLLTTIDLTKEQKKLFKIKSEELNNIVGQYDM